MFLHRILSLFYLLVLKFSADAVFHRSSLAFHDVAFNHLLATTPTSQSGSDSNDTCADFPPLYNEANEMVKGNISPCPTRRDSPVIKVYFDYISQ